MEQAIINPPLPGDLNLILNAKTSVSVGAFTTVNGDVASGATNGSVLFDVSSSQGFGGFNLLASTVTVRTNASVGRVVGNDLTIDGFATQQTLGLDPAALPQVPAIAAVSPGTVGVSTNQNQLKQLCPGRYGAISLGANSTLNLNGGVYQVTRLTLADGARLEPSEPVVRSPTSLREPTSELAQRLSRCCESAQRRARAARVGCTRRPHPRFEARRPRHRKRAKATVASGT